MDGPSNKAVTIMDGPFPSLYPWNEDAGLVSLTSAKFTPFGRVKTWAEAKALLEGLTRKQIFERASQMIEQMAFYYPAVKQYYYVTDCLLGIRAMPKSGADARLVDIVKIGERSLRVRAGKIDAVLYAEEEIARMISPDGVAYKKPTNGGIQLC